MGIHTVLLPAQFAGHSKSWVQPRFPHRKDMPDCVTLAGHSASGDLAGGQRLPFWNLPRALWVSLKRPHSLLTLSKSLFCGARIHCSISHGSKKISRHPRPGHFPISFCCCLSRFSNQGITNVIQIPQLVLTQCWPPFPNNP